MNIASTLLVLIPEPVGLRCRAAVTSRWARSSQRNSVQPQHRRCEWRLAGGASHRNSVHRCASPERATDQTPDGIHRPFGARPFSAQSDGSHHRLIFERPSGPGPALQGGDGSPSRPCLQAKPARATRASQAATNAPNPISDRPSGIRYPASDFLLP